MAGFDDLGGLEEGLDLRTELRILGKKISESAYKGKVVLVENLLRRRRGLLLQKYNLTYRALSEIRNRLAHPDLPSETREDLEDTQPEYEYILTQHLEKLDLHKRYSRYMLRMARKKAA